MGIHVDALGGLRVFVDGEESRDLPGQAIRCGLLLHIAVERQALRESLLSLFWPDRDPARAKHSLSQTLYELSIAIGSDDWLDRRADRLCATEGLGVDAQDFEAALRRKDWEEALRLYAGPFLGRHQLAPTVEFEHWAESVRARLLRGFEEACEGQLRALLARGSLEDALAVGRRWARASHLSESASYALIETLARMGREAEAVQEFNRYEQTLSNELGVSPSRRIRRLVDDVRSGKLPAQTATKGGDRARRATDLGLDPTRVVVLPFENLGPDRESDYFADGMAETIASRLVSEGGLTVVPRSSVRGLTDRAMRVSEIGAAHRAGTVVQGTVQKSAHRVRVSASVVDAASDATRWAKTFDGTLDDIFDIQTQVATGIVTALGHRPEARATLSGIGWTASPEAYDLYLRGRYLAASSDETSLRTGLHYLQRAVEKDPRFSAAAARASDVYGKLEAQTRLGTFHGRRSELEVLERAAASALAGRGGLITVSGPPGIGKTSLFLKFRQGVDALEAGVHQTRCRPYRVGAPFFPIQAVLRDALDLQDAHPSEDAVVGRLARIDADLAEDYTTRVRLLGAGAPSTDREGALNDERLRAAVESSLFRLTSALARERPRIFFFDDWQWSDEASHEAVLGLVRRIEELPVLIVVGSRISQPDAWRGVLHTHLDLGPLGSEDVHAMAASLLQGAPVRAEILHSLSDATGGNPFHIEEACRALQEEEGDPGSRRASPARQLPSAVSPGIDSVIRARFDRLDRPDAEALELAAVLGAEISVQLLSQIAESPEGLPLALQRLQALNLIRPIVGAEEPAFEFRHDITHGVALGSVPKDRGRELHRKAAQALETRHAEGNLDAVVEELAFHWAEAEDPVKAPLYLELAGDKARGSFSLADARRHYRRAIELLDAAGPADRRRIDLSFKLTEASIQAASSDLLELLEHSRRVAIHLRDRVREARALYWLGWTHYALGDQLNAKELLRRCLDMVLSQEDERLLAQVYLNIGYSHAAATEYDEAVEYFRKGRQRRPLDAGNRSQGLAYAIGYEAMMLGDRGRFEQAHDRLEEGFALVEGLGRRSVEGSYRTQRAMVLFFQGEWEACIEAAEEILGIGRELGSHYIEAISRTIDGYARFMLGDLGGLANLREAIRIMDASGALLIMSWNCACLAEALVMAGERAEGERIAERALARGSVHDWLGEPTAHRALARIAVAGPEPDWVRFQEHLQGALARAEAKGSPREQAITHLTAAQILADHGRSGDARKHLAQSEPLFLDMGMRWYVAAAEAVGARLRNDSHLNGI